MRTLHNDLINTEENNDMDDFKLPNQIIEEYMELNKKLDQTISRIKDRNKKNNKK